MLVRLTLLLLFLCTSNISLANQMNRAVDCKLNGQVYIENINYTGVESNLTEAEVLLTNLQSAKAGDDVVIVFSRNATSSRSKHTYVVSFKLDSVTDDKTYAAKTIMQISDQNQNNTAFYNPSYIDTICTLRIY